MSWIERLKNNILIKTGQGTPFEPSWLNATRDISYNVVEFEFADVSGTLVKRTKPKGIKYNLEIYFQGEGCLDLADKFEKAARDPRPWNIIHPFYGSIKVQPLGLHIDNTQYNVSKITGTVVETIDEDNPQGEVDDVGRVIDYNFKFRFKAIEGFQGALPITTTKTQTILTKNVNKAYSAMKKKITNNVDASNAFNKFNTALSAINVLANDVSNAITLVTDLIEAPIKFIQSVKARIAGLVTQFNDLRDTIIELRDTASDLFGLDSKVSYEVNAGATIGAMAEAAVTDMDYLSRQDIISVIEQIIAAYNQYIIDLDSFQDLNGGNPNNYIPNVEALMAMSVLIHFTISSLFTIGLGSKQERVLYLEKDTNIINLTHRLIGLDDVDNNMNTIISTNNIGLNELMLIKKDRKIIWYV